MARRLVVGVALCSCAGPGAAWRSGCGARAPTSEVSQEPIQVSNCEEARKYPDRIALDDVRFVECDQRDDPGDAAALGSPVYIGSSERTAADALEYTRGRCVHGGGAISHHNVFYKPENVDAAIECSWKRCESKDPLGCFDLGTLHSSNDVGDAFFPAVRPDVAKATAAFEAGCRLGHADSCMMLASWHEQRHGPDESAALFERACMALPPQLLGCLRRGESLLAAGKEVEARSYLRRACRGVTRQKTPFAAERLGCGLLANLAAQHGDVLSQREYLRLECAYGAQAPQACADLGLLLIEQGDKRKAVPYLKRACEALTDSKTRFARACGALAQLTNG
jgi:hypothetical protein